MEKILSSILGDPSLSIMEHLENNIKSSCTLRAIIEDSDLLFNRKRACVHENNSKIISVCGIPGSGKSYYIKSLNKNFFVISFDEIMENFSSYKKLLSTDKEKAFSIYEYAARAIGYIWLKECIESKIPLIFEHSNTVPQHISLYQLAKFVYGYHVEIHFISTPPNITLSRIASRERHCPQHYAQERWGLLQQLLPAYKVIADTFLEIPFNPQH